MARPSFGRTGKVYPVGRRFRDSVTGKEPVLQLDLQVAGGELEDVVHRDGLAALDLLAAESDAVRALEVEDPEDALHDRQGHVSAREHLVGDHGPAFRGPAE